jgi:hypothetical protein
MLINQNKNFVFAIVDEPVVIYIYFAVDAKLVFNVAIVRYFLIVLDNHQHITACLDYHIFIRNMADFYNGFTTVIS